MKKQTSYILVTIIALLSVISCETKDKKDKENLNKPTTSEIWEIDFFDDFDTFNTDNWQDQRIWVNNEKQSYVPNGEFGTREVSNGTLKLKVINIGEKRSSDNLDKFGKQNYS